jgi:hypothetical protein
VRKKARKKFKRCRTSSTSVKFACNSLSGHGTCLQTFNHVLVYPREDSAWEEKSVDGTNVLISIVVILYRMQEESPSGKSPVAGLYNHCNNFLKVIWSEEFINQISNYHSLKKYCAGRRQ